jgi:hypothetical protein
MSLNIRNTPTNEENRNNISQRGHIVFETNNPREHHPRETLSQDPLS